jgi:hypothetical protein
MDDARRPFEQPGCQDPVVGKIVEARSVGGVSYAGVVRAVRYAGELGELFELGSPDDPGYRRLVLVADRATDLRELDALDDVARDGGPR